MTITISLHQKLVNEAVDHMRANKLTYRAMFESLDKPHKVAIVFKNLNHHVHNGGFFQWKDNKYNSEIDLLFLYLEEMGSDSAKQVAKLLHIFQGIQQMLTGDDEEDEEDEAYLEIDRAYWAISDKFLAEINEWLGTI